MARRCRWGPTRPSFCPELIDLGQDPPVPGAKPTSLWIPRARAGTVRQVKAHDLRMNGESPIPRTPSASSAWRKWRWALGLLALAFLLLAARRFQLQAWLQSALGWVDGLGPWGPVVFIALYVVACVFFVPGSILTLGAGASFGVVRGGLYVIVGATLGATCAFLVGRHLARGWVTDQLQRQPKLQAIDEAVAREGWKIVLLTRLSPILPFTLLNYAFGVTRVSLAQYVVASFFGMLPGTLLYVWLGAVAGTLAAPGGTRIRTPAEWTFYGVGFAATLAATLLIARIAKTALANKINP